MLGTAYRVTLTDDGRGVPGDLLLALHARRSAASVAAWAAQQPRRPLILALTGTDLYRDIASDAQAQQSLQLADRLLVLNELGPQALPAALRPKCRVLLQSCSSRQPLAKPVRHLRALMVGHLREEKDPETYWRAAGRLQGRRDILLDHIGSVLEPALGTQAQALAARLPQFRWLGGLPHAQARRRIQAAHVLVHASRMEGGANAVVEALRSGTPVLASRIDGNVGLLGPQYPGLFEPGDDGGLAVLLQRCRDEPSMLATLQAAGTARAGLFAPERERATLLRAVRELLPEPEPNPETPR